MKKIAPTPKAEQVRVGDKCASVFGTRVCMVGVVEKIVKTASIPYAVVRWSSGSVGRHTITTLKVIP